MFPVRRLTSCRLVLVGLLLCHAFLLGWSAWKHSPTYNEAAHLAAGVSHWSLKSFSLFMVNPPGVRMVAALPVLFHNPRTNWARAAEPPISRPESDVGIDFIYANGTPAIRWIALARWACIPFSLLGACACFAWADRLFGERSGLLSAALWCFSPYALGYSALIVADAHAASVGVVAFYAFWGWLRNPGWSRAAIAGVLLGLAQLTKFTLLVFYPLLPLVWLLYRSHRPVANPPRRPTTEAWMLVTVVVISIYVINLGYAFEGSCRRLGDFRFHTTALTGARHVADIPATGSNRFEDSWVGQLPVPLPASYVEGIDLQKHDFERRVGSYLAGEWADRGWWYYYLYALSIKTPIGTLCLFALAVGVSLAGRRPLAAWRDEFVVLAPGLAILAVVSSQTGLSAHSRYALPALPFLYIWTSKVARVFQDRDARRGHRVLASMIILAATWSVSSSLWNYPHSLSYFNELAGGPEGGPRHLLNSNIDWSQDFFFLKDWLDAHPDVKLNGLRCYGNFFGPLIGLPKVPFPPPVTRLCATASSDGEFPLLPGWYALSANEVYKRSQEYRYFLRFRRASMAGYSIFIYHVTADDVARLRRHLRDHAQ